MYDRGTQSLWSHITGEAIRGRLKGKRLKMLASMPQIAWQTWRTNYPKTRVLSVQSKSGRQEAKSRDVYADYHASQRAGVSGMDYTDDRLPNKSLVIGVQVADTYRAYPLALFAETSLINDEVDGVPLLIFHDKDSFATAVFARALGDTVLTFEMRKDARFQTAPTERENGGGRLETAPTERESKGGRSQAARPGEADRGSRLQTASPVMDNSGYFARDDSGTRWNLITGKATAGKRKLRRLPAVNIYWFAWARYHPETSVYR